MNIQKLNDIIRRDGTAAGLRSARAAQMPGWIIGRLEDGSWDPDHQPQKLEKTQSSLGRNGDVELTVHRLGSEIVKITKTVYGESGNPVSCEDIGHTDVTAAMRILN